MSVEGHLGKGSRLSAPAARYSSTAILRFNFNWCPSFSPQAEQLQSGEAGSQFQQSPATSDMGGLFVVSNEESVAELDSGASLQFQQIPQFQPKKRNT